MMTTQLLEMPVLLVSGSERDRLPGEGLWIIIPHPGGTFWRSQLMVQSELDWFYRFYRANHEQQLAMIASLEPLYEEQALKYPNAFTVWGLHYTSHDGLVVLDHLKKAVVHGTASAVALQKNPYEGGNWLLRTRVPQVGTRMCRW